MTTDRIWTVGHSTLSKEQFLSELADADIDLLADVRSLPGSRHNPQFNQEDMQIWLPESDVLYRHLEDLGGRRRNKAADPVLNAGWQNASFRSYADYTLTDDYERGLAELDRLAGDHRVAIMCAEAVPWRCHRSLIANTLVARGREVEHLMFGAAPIPHEVGRWGADAVVDDGTVTYPAAD